VAISLAVRSDRACFGRRRTWLYRLAARELHERAQNRARLVALLIPLGGIATLFLDFTGILG